MRFLYYLLYPILCLNRYPTFVEFKAFYLVTFGIFVSLGAFIGFSLLCYYILAYRINLTFWDYSLLTLIPLSGIVGARLYGIFMNRNDKVKYYDLGGHLFTIIITIVIAYIINLNFIILLDATAYGAAISMALGRIGCYTAGCCYGRTTKSQLGVQYQNPASIILIKHPKLCGVSVIPTQLWSALFNFLIFLLLTFIINIAKPAGTMALIYLILYGLFRLFIQRYRNQDMLERRFHSLTINLSSATLIVIGIVILLYNIFSTRTTSIVQLPHDLAFSNYFTFLFGTPQIYLFTFVAVIYFINYGIRAKNKKF